MEESSEIMFETRARTWRARRDVEDKWTHEEQAHGEQEAYNDRPRQVSVVHNIRIYASKRIEHGHALRPYMSKVDPELLSLKSTLSAAHDIHAEYSTPSSNGGSPSKPPVPKAVHHGPTG